VFLANQNRISLFALLGENSFHSVGIGEYKGNGFIFLIKLR
jgi:hypothetical protein